ncbi:UNVERIFIED_CONTAM: hypothetical protein GTU68_010334 [Idotea baltica]|nr:hypothetical protein [Idotea baltica]
MENAVDAGATEIQLIIKNAGKSLIQITDNGSGMSETDMRMAFERHATSKIKRIEDLESINTMGFRGEALASIAAIAQVEVKTRLADRDLGNLLRIEGSKIVEQAPCSCNAGTSISIKNLFFNVPARRKFLKSNTVETRHIIDEFQKVALAYPHIQMNAFHDGKELFRLKSGNEKQRIVSVFGKAYNERLVPIEEATDFLSVTGYIGKPEFARKTRGEQYFFVNKRFIKSPYLHHAVKSAFEELLQKDQYPFYVIYIEIDPDKIDINVHPSKHEIKFSDERIVYTFVNGAVKRALNVYSVTPSLDFDQEAQFQFPGLSANANHPQGQQDQNKSNNFRSNYQKEDTSNWQNLFKTGNLPSQEDSLTLSSALNDTVPDAQGRVLQQQSEINPFQIHRQYILYQIKSGLILVDQQAAHFRILYEQYIAYLKGDKANVQQLLFPSTIQLNPADAELLNSILEDIKTLGFDIDPLGPHDFAIRGIPAVARKINEQQVFDKLLEQFKSNARQLQLDNHSNLAQSMAWQTGIKRGMDLQKEELKALIDQLFACKEPMTSPAGAATFITLSLDELGELFHKAY